MHSADIVRLIGVGNAEENQSDWLLGLGLNVLQQPAINTCFTPIFLRYRRLGI
jgi:hypothetical protein